MKLYSVAAEYLFHVFLKLVSYADLTARIGVPGAREDVLVHESELGHTVVGVNWTVKELMTECDAALDALYATIHPTKKFLSMNRDWVDYKSWASLRMMGPYIIAHDSVMSTKRIDVIGDLPNFAIVGFMQPEREKGYSFYSFVAITKLSCLPPGTAPIASGYPYEVQVCPVFKNGSVSIQGLVTIDTDGFVHPVMVREPGKYNQKVWRVADPVYEVFAIEMAKRKCPVPTISEIVCLSMNGYLGQSMNVCVRAGDHRGLVNFGIELPVAKRIFKERITALTKTGKRKPILHWVIAHKRSSGSNVRTHIRGSRVFVWDGMDIEIVIPKRHRPLAHLCRPLVMVPGTRLLSRIFKTKKRAVTLPFSGEKVEIEAVEGASDEEMMGTYYMVDVESRKEKETVGA